MRLADLWLGRLFRFVLCFALTYIVVALFTDAPVLILIENGIAMSVAAAVCVTYAPVLLGSLRTPDPRKGDFLGSGIFFVSLSVLGMRVLSFIARDLGYPQVYNSDWTTAVISSGIMGGLFHIWAPYARDGATTRVRWLSTGIIVGAGVLLCFVAWNVHVTTGQHPAVELR